MSAETLVKQPAESRLFSMDFSPLLASGETIASVDSVTASPTDDATPLVIGVASFSGQSAAVRISAGTSGTRYTVTFVVTTSAGNTVESEGILQVKDL